MDDAEYKTVGTNLDTSPDGHPLNQIDLSHLDSLPDAQQEQVRRMLLRRYRTMQRDESDVGMTDWAVHDIELRPGSEPTAEPQRHYPLHKREKILETVRDLEDRDIIEKASSAWRSFPTLAKKKNSEGEWEEAKRFCVDLRSLNAKTVKHARLLPKVSEVVNSLTGSKYFTKLDLAGAYHQVPLTERAKDMTSFAVPGGSLYRYRSMCFGLVNAGATFQALMDSVLAELSWNIVICYIDDVIVFSNSFDDHLRDVELVLERLELAGLKAKPSKCAFFVDRVEILGHVVTEHGVQPEDHKVEAVKCWPVPTCVKELQSFLAFANFFRRFIKGFSKEAWALNKLTHKDVPWAWEATHQEAFQKLKDLLISAPVMALPDTSKPWVLDTDWSRRGIGYCLLQPQEDGHLHPVLYGSKSLTKAESKYASTRGEFLAMFEGLMACRHYLLGSTNFQVRCDNKALSYLRSYKDPTHRTARMLELIADFGDFPIKFVEGKKNIPADALSRLPVPVPHEEVTFKQLEPQEQMDTPVVGALMPVNWVEAQDKDPDVKMLKAWLQADARPPKEQVNALNAPLKSYWHSFQQFELKDGKVIRRWTDDDTGLARDLIVVPVAQREAVLKGLHENGHPGTTRLVLALKHKFYWHKMSTDAERFVNLCKTCQLTKARHNRAPLVQDQVGFMSQKVFMDIKGELPETVRGNKFYLVVVDGFSKWVGLYPVPDIRAPTVYQTLYDNWIINMGVPVQLHTDQGSSLVGTLGRAVVDLLNINHTTSVSHHPMSNGAVERRVRSSLTVIRSIMQEEEQGIEWDMACPKAMLAINTTPTSTTLTPWLIKHSSGEECIIPSSLTLDTLPSEQSVDVTVRKLRERQQKMFHKVSKETGKSLQRQKINYDRKVYDQDINVGDFVRYVDFSNVKSDESKSLRAKYQNKLYKVQGKLSNVNYCLENTETGKTLITHFNHIKKVSVAESDREPGVTARRSVRTRQMPAHLRDYDLDDGNPKVL